MFTKFYHGTTRKIIVAFGALFKNIHIDQLDSAGTAIDYLVPLDYSPKKKWVRRVYEQTDLENGPKTEITLPRMGYNMTTMGYSPERKLTTMNQTVYQIPNADGTYKSRYERVAYDMSFELNIISKNTDDALQIMEQIVPYFTPSFTITLNLITGTDEEVDIIFNLSSVSQDDNFEGAFPDRRDILWTLSFNVQTYLYGPIIDKEVIKKVIADINFGDDPIAIMERITITPDPVDAEAGDDFDITIVIEEGPEVVE